MDIQHNLNGCETNEDIFYGLGVANRPRTTPCEDLKQKREAEEAQLAAQQEEKQQAPEETVKDRLIKAGILKEVHPTGRRLLKSMEL